MPAAKTVKKSATPRPKAEIERLPTPDEAGAAFVPLERLESALLQ